MQRLMLLVVAVVDSPAVVGASLYASSAYESSPTP